MNEAGHEERVRLPAGDDASVREYGRQLAMDSLLDHALRGKGAAWAVVRPPARAAKRFWRLILPLAAAAALVLCGYGIYLRRPAPLGLRLAQFQGAVAVTRAGQPVPLSPGLALRDGDRVAVPKSGQAALQYDSEATRLELHAATATFGAEKGAKRVKLAAGTLVCTVAPQRLPLTIQTPQAVARVLGTRFRLEADAAATRLEVMAGQVRLTRAQDNASVDVPAGHQAAVARGVELQVKPIRAPGTLLALDFEAGPLPLLSIGTIVAGPRPANSRFCAAGNWVKDERSFTVRLWDGTGPLFTYREGLVLSFDYWVKKPTGALDVYFWNTTRSVSPGANVWAPAQEQWTHATLRLAEFNKESRDGDLITELVIKTTPNGNELFVDNIRIAVEEEP